MLKLYTFAMAPFSRATNCFMEMNKIPHERHIIDLGKFEQKNPEFLKVNPLGKIPVLDDDGLIITRSQAIMMYLHETRGLDDHWYPRDARKRAAVNEFLFWGDEGLQSSGKIFFKEYLMPKMGAPAPDAKEISKLHKETEDALSYIENKYPQMEKNFLFGDQITIADLILANGINWIRAVDFKLDRWENFSGWFSRVMEIPEVAQENFIMNKIINKALKERKEALEKIEI